MSDLELPDVDLNELTLQYANRIKEFQMKPKTRVFIISSKFLKGLETFPETKKVPKVQNSELKNALSSMSTVSTNKSKNKKKSKSQKSKIPQIMKDYYPIDENLWNDIVEHFGGGPEIAYFVCDDCSIDFTNFQINVKCGQEKKCIQTSMKTDLQTFHLQVLDAFGYDFNDKYKLCANNSATPISIEGTVGGRIANEKLLILTVHYQEPDPKVVKQAEKDKTAQLNQAKKEKKDPSDNKSDESEIKSHESSRPLGLKNTGNSCYMNSVIQCFASVNFLTNSLKMLQNEAVETLKTIDRLGINASLRGLPGKLHVGQSKTTEAFISLINNLKNNIPEKSDDYFTKKPQQNRKGGRRSKTPKYVKNYTPAKVQTAIHVKKSMSLFSNNQQQDAHEFFSFLLDAVHDECPCTIEKIFYGKCKRTTTCALCGHESVIIEDFSSLPLPISNALKVLYSPYDLTKPMKRIQSIPDNLKERVVLIGKTRKGNKVATKMSPEFIEVIALEIPDLSNSKQNPTENEGIDQISAENKYSNVENIDNDEALNNEEEANNEDENEDNSNNNDGNENNNSNDNNNSNNNNNDNNNDNNTNNNNNNDNDDSNINNNNNDNDANTNSNNTDNNDNKNDNNESNEDGKNNDSTNNGNNENDNNDDNNKSNTNGENANPSADKTPEANKNETDQSDHPNDNEHPNDESESTTKDIKYGIALLRVINKKSNEKTLPLLVKVPLNVQLTEEEITSIVKERLAPILQQPDAPIKLIAPPVMFVKDDDKPLCRNPLGCHITCPIQPTRLESLFTKSEVPISVDELLDSFFSKMQLDEDNMWLCEVCKNNSCAYQQVKLLDTEAGEETEEVGDSNNKENEEANEKKEDTSNQLLSEQTQNNEETNAGNQSEQVEAEQNKEETKDASNNQQCEQKQEEDENLKEQAKSEQESNDAEATQTDLNNEPSNKQQNSTKEVELNDKNSQQQDSQPATAAEPPQEAEKIDLPQDDKSANEANNEQQKQQNEAENDQSKSQPNDKTDELQDNQPNANPPQVPTDDNNKKKPFHLPKCLVLQLKRFLSKNGRLAKDPTTVVVPHFIDVSRFVEFLNPDGSSSTKQADENSSNYLYKLCAVSNHAGSLQGGHYTAYGERKGSWYTFNDSAVSSNNSIFNGKSNDCFGSSNAYLLFYSKVDQK